MSDYVTGSCRYGKSDCWGLQLPVTEVIFPSGKSLRVCKGCSYLLHNVAMTKYKHGVCKELMCPNEGIVQDLTSIITGEGNRVYLCSDCHARYVSITGQHFDFKSSIRKISRFYLAFVKIVVRLLFVVIPITLVVVGLQTENYLSIGIGAFCLFLGSILLAKKLSKLN